MSEVRKLWISGAQGRLEAALRVCPAPRATALVAHPHPLHGGTLDNPVVFHVDRELNRRGLTTLRFNFRGVGSSEGEHDGGRGEIEDLGAAASWLRGLAPAAPLLLVGYSFGSICAIRHAVQSSAIRGVVAIGLPVELYPIEELDRLTCPLAVVQGSDDEFGSPDSVQLKLDRIDTTTALIVVDRAPHLFTDLAREAASAVVEASEWLLSRL